MGRFTDLCFAASSAAHAGKPVYDLSAVGGSYQLHRTLCSQLQTSEQCVTSCCGTLYGHVYFCMTRMRNTDLPQKKKRRRRKFRRKFRDDRISNSKQFTIWRTELDLWYPKWAVQNPRGRWDYLRGR
jgi:hypothetical protein